MIRINQNCVMVDGEMFYSEEQMVELLNEINTLKQEMEKQNETQKTENAERA